MLENEYKALLVQLIALWSYAALTLFPFVFLCLVREQIGKPSVLICHERLNAVAKSRVLPVQTHSIGIVYTTSNAHW